MCQRYSTFFFPNLFQNLPVYCLLLVFLFIKYVEVGTTGLFTRGVFLIFFLPQPIIHIATIS
jgi:hypothetical protein